jgi:hypothetical protein
MYDEPYENRCWEKWNNVPETLILDKYNIPIMASDRVLDKPFSPLFGIHLKYLTLPC